MTLWTVACQAPLSMGFPRQNYWSGLPCPPPEELPNPGIQPASFASPALAGGFFTTSAIWEGPWKWKFKNSINPVYSLWVGRGPAVHVLPEFYMSSLKQGANNINSFVLGYLCQFRLCPQSTGNVWVFPSFQSLLIYVNDWKPPWGKLLNVLVTVLQASSC